MAGPQVLQSEAVPVVLALEQAGVSFNLQADGLLQLVHAEGVPPALVAAVRAHRGRVVLLAAWQLPEVQARYTVFEQRLAEADPAIVLPLLVYRLEVPWRAGHCWSCNEPIAPRRYGRCFWCRAAWHLLVDQPMPVAPAESRLHAEQGAA